MFLSTNDLQALTNYKYAAKQINWLNDHGYKYDIAGDGKPRVLKEYIEEILGASKTKRYRSNKPNLEALNQ